MSGVKVLHKPLIHIYSCIKQLFLRNKTLHFSYKGGVVCVGVVCVLICLKEELALGIHI